MRSRWFRRFGNSSKSNPPATTKLAADRMGAFLAGSFEAAGGRARSASRRRFRGQRANRFCRTRKAKPVLLLGHFDTVYPLGTLANMPCHVADGRMHGPGVLDMKSGIALMLFAIAALKRGTGACRGRLPCFWFRMKKWEATLRARSRKRSPRIPRQSCAGASGSARRGEDGAQRRGRIHVDRERCCVACGARSEEGT